MKSLTALLIIITLNYMVVSKTLFKVSFEHQTMFKIEANEGQTLKITYKDKFPVTSILAYWIITADKKKLFCLYIATYQTCSPNNEINQDMATFLGKTISYHQMSENYAQYTIWKDEDHEVFCEQKLKDNISKMKNRFISVDDLLFLA
jgi:hypothetical protein